MAKTGFTFESASVLISFYSLFSVLASSQSASECLYKAEIFSQFELLKKRKKEKKM